MKQKYDTLTYINSIGKTVGKLERLDDNLFRISYTDDFKEFLKYKDIKLLVKEGTYSKIPDKILSRIPKGNSQNEKWQRNRHNYQKDYFDPIYWLNITTGLSNHDLWSFSKEPINELMMSYLLEEERIKNDIR